jgi:hypothetical protein
MPHEFSLTLSTKIVTVLGFSHAEWPQICCSLRVSGMQVITTSEQLLTSNESIYERHHNRTVVHAKANRPIRDSLNVSQAISEIQAILLNLNEPKSRQEILVYILVHVLMEYNLNDNISLNEFNDLLQKIEASTFPNQALLDVLMSHTRYFDDLLNNNALSGFSMFNILRKSNKIQEHLRGTDQDKLTNLLNILPTINLESKGYAEQSIITNCKKLIVDTLQINLSNLANGEPLIGIKIFVAIEGGEGLPFFEPNWQQTTAKIDFGRTNAEVRMLYKLAKELSHPLINLLMQFTTKFYKKVGDDILEINPPWEQDVALWLNRKRTSNKPAYAKRGREETQPWVLEFYCLADNITNQLMAKELAL